MANIVATTIGTRNFLKNSSRIKEILFVLAKHGLQDFSESISIVLGLGDLKFKKKNNSISKKSDSNFYRKLGEKLYLSFEELGPVFIKFGQLLSTRNDLFKDEFLKELKPLCDNIKPISFSKLLEQLGEEDVNFLYDNFSDISERPLGVASIGIVYKAYTKDKKSVILKIKRPNIEKNLDADFSLLKMISEKIEKNITPNMSTGGLNRFVEEFISDFKKELNYNYELNNTIAFSKLNINNSVLVIPKIYNKLSTNSLLTIEYLKGKSFNKIKKEEVEENEYIIKKAIEEIIGGFLREGLFHADLHPGNLRLLNDKVGLIDFGLVVKFNKKERIRLIIILHSLVNSNYERLVYEFLELASFEEMPDINKLVIDVKKVLGNTNNINTLGPDLIVMLKNVITLFKKHQLDIPSDWITLIRGLLSLDGMIKSLDINMDLFETLKKNNNINYDLLNKEEVLLKAPFLVKDIVGLIEEVPRQLKWYIGALQKNSYTNKFEVKGVSNSINNLSNSIKDLSKSVFSIGFIFTGFYVINNNITFKSINSFSLVLFTIGGLFLLFTINKKLK